MAYTYSAFISYRHLPADIEAAKAVQRAICRRTLKRQRLSSGRWKPTGSRGISAKRPA